MSWREAGPLDPPNIGSFTVGRLPRIAFGPGALAALPSTLGRHGRRVLAVTGHQPLRGSARFPNLADNLLAAGLELEEVTVEGEPTPGLIDDAVRRHRARTIDVVLGLGGGSALDTAKAIAGLLRTDDSILDHLEGVGPERPYAGPATPFVAVPTTAGTGSEATKNAVVTVRGQFKRSFRDDRLVAADAIVDPDLLASCPKGLIAANGMDALTQLIESCVSLRAGPFTDALAMSGLRAVRTGLVAWHGAVRDGQPDADVAVAGRTAMSYAALLSGICLAQAGLGASHGLAAALGGPFTIPHGIACGATLGATVRVNVTALHARDPDGEALRRYANVGRALAGGVDASGVPDAAARDRLIAVLEAWRSELGIPGLASFGVNRSDVSSLVAASRGSSMRTNPIVLTDDEVAAIVEMSL